MEIIEMNYVIAINDDDEIKILESLSPDLTPEREMEALQLLIDTTRKREQKKKENK